MMKLSIRVVDGAYVNQTWPFVAPFIEDALQKGGDFPDWSANYNAEHIRLYVTSGSWLLIVAVDEEGKLHGACTVSFVNYPLHRVAFITSIGGKLITSEDALAQFKNILRASGATKIQGYVRESMVRLSKRYNFEPRNTLVETLI